MSICCREWQTGDPSLSSAYFRADVRNGQSDLGSHAEVILTGAGINGHKVWNTDANGYLKSGTVAVELDVDNGNPCTASLTVDSTVVNRTRPTFNYIRMIGLQACVLDDDIIMHAKWTSATVTLYDAEGNSIAKDGSQSPCVLPHAYCTQVGTANVPQIHTVFVPSDNTRVRAVISGTIELEAEDQPADLLPTKVVCRIYVWTA
jgi:hypothetical protein